MTVVLAEAAAAGLQHRRSSPPSKTSPLCWWRPTRIFDDIIGKYIQIFKISQFFFVYFYVIFPKKNV
jgi:hypothetical protein